MSTSQMLDEFESSDDESIVAPSSIPSYTTLLGAYAADNNSGSSASGSGREEEAVDTAANTAPYNKSPLSSVRPASSVPSFGSLLGDINEVTESENSSSVNEVADSDDSSSIGPSPGAFSTASSALAAARTLLDNGGDLSDADLASMTPETRQLVENALALDDDSIELP